MNAQAFRENSYIQAEALYIQFAVVKIKGFHLFPFRTQKLSPYTPMVLTWETGWESRKLPHSKYSSVEEPLKNVFCLSGQEAFLFFRKTFRRAFWRQRVLKKSQKYVIVLRSGIVRFYHKCICFSRGEKALSKGENYLN